MYRQFITDSLSLKYTGIAKVKMCAIAKRFTYNRTYSFTVYHIVCNECSSFYDTAHIEDVMQCKHCENTVNKKDIHIVN